VACHGSRDVLHFVQPTHGRASRGPGVVSPCCLCRGPDVDAGGSKTFMVIPEGGGVTVGVRRGADAPKVQRRAV
jgi:hypothetical protein